VENLGIFVVIVTAMGFNYTNGFHDAANAIATSVSTRALTPRVALAMAAVFNLVGSFLGAKVAKTVGSGIIELPDGKSSLVIVFAALLGAHRVEPAHLVLRAAVVVVARADRRAGGRRPRLVEHGAVGRHRPQSRHPDDRLAVRRPDPRLPGDGRHPVAVPEASPARVTRGFRAGQSVSAAAMSLGHGMQDAPRRWAWSCSRSRSAATTPATASRSGCTS
jgi:PiT family inorganic phosphate transporter